MAVAAEQVIGVVKRIGRLQKNGRWLAAGAEGTMDMRRHGGENRGGACIVWT